MKKPVNFGLLVETIHKFLKPFIGKDSVKGVLSF